MTKENVQRIHRIYSILLSIVIVVAGICLIVACVDIYQSGDKPFSREAVADAFSSIAIPVYLCLIMTIIGIIWEFVSPTTIKDAKPEKPYAHMVKKLYAKKDLTQCEDTLRTKIMKEQKSRKIHYIIRTVLLCVASIIFLIYALNKDNFHQSEINDSMIKAMMVLLPCLAVSFAYTLFTVIYNEKSLQREIELLKQAPAATETFTKDETNHSDKIIFITRIALLVVGLGILIYGYVAGGTVDVLTKAINICTECIGLG